jgi:ATP-dependent Lon protease
MSAGKNSDDRDLPEVDDDIVSTGAAADSADWDERLKGLPRLLRYAVLVIAESDHVEQRLIAEIDELCPRLPLNAAWAMALDTGLGVALANELDHRAVASNEPELRSLADCARLLSLPMPSDTTYFEEHRRVGKALIQAFRKASHGLEEELRSDLEGFVFAWAALPACTDLVMRNRRAALNATILAPLMFTYSIDAAKDGVWRQVRKQEEQRRRQEEENAEAEASEAQQVSSPATKAVPGRSLVIARLSEAERKNIKLKDILGPFKGVINEALPLVEAPPLHEVRNKLLSEFPYAADVIDFALADLVGRTTVRLRPLLIVGDPGGGKSRFARRLGEELGVSVWRTDASQCDGAVFAGTSRRWHSAEPCHPFLAVVQGKIANPLVLIDELDKAASRSDYGRLWDALLGFLEMETNTRYPDPALQTNLDLSQVSYVATANRLDPLPSPIRDRFRMVTFPKPAAEDLDALLPAVLADLARERGLDRNWLPPLAGMQRVAVAQLWRGGSVRRLYRIVEAVLRERDANTLKN